MTLRSILAPAALLIDALVSFGMGCSAKAQVPIPSAMGIDLRYVLEPDKVIGPLQAGVLCLPKGSLHWEEIRLPDKNEAEQAIVSAWKRGEEPWRVQVAVEGARIRLCMPGLKALMGKPKGRGTLSIRWQKLSEDGLALGEPVVVEAPIMIDGVDPRRSSGPVLHALTEAAKIYANTVSGVVEP